MMNRRNRCRSSRSRSSSRSSNMSGGSSVYQNSNSGIVMTDEIEDYFYSLDRSSRSSDLLFLTYDTRLYSYNNNNNHSASEEEEAAATGTAGATAATSNLLDALCELYLPQKTNIKKCTVNIEGFVEAETSASVETRTQDEYLRHDVRAYRAGLERLGRALSRIPGLMDLKVYPKVSIAEGDRPLDLRSAACLLRQTRHDYHTNWHNNDSDDTKDKDNDCCKLLELSIKFNGICRDAHAMADLAHSLQHHPTLQKVSLFSLELDTTPPHDAVTVTTDTVAMTTVLEDALLSIQTLKQIGSFASSVHDERTLFCSPTFLKRLICKPTLTDLCLVECSFQPLQWQALCHALGGNKKKTTTTRTTTVSQYNNNNNTTTNSETQVARVQSLAMVGCSFPMTSLSSSLSSAINDDADDVYPKQGNNNNNYYGTGCSGNFVEQLAAAISTNTSLRELRFHPAHGILTTAAAADTAPHNHHHHHHPPPTIVGAVVDDKDGADGTTTTTTTTGATGGGRRPGQVLGRALGRHAHLETLDLKIPMDASAAETHEWAQLLWGLHGSRTLQRVNLCKFRWTREMCHSLKQLLLGNTNCTGTTTTTGTTASKNTTTANNNSITYYPPLTTLNIEDLKTDDEWRGIAACLALSKTLMTLSVEGTFSSYNSEEPRSEAILSEMGTVLETCTTLTSLTLRTRSKCSASYLTSFLTSLNRQNNVTFSSIKLNFSTIKSSSSSSSSSSNVDNEDDTDVVVDQTTQFAEEAQAVMESVKRNYNLTLIGGVFGNPLFRDPAYQAWLEALLSMNAAGRRYVKTDPCNLHQGMTVLVAAHHNLDAINMHLHENPFLCQRK